MRYTYTLAGIALLTILLATACGGGGGLNLDGTQWELSELNGQPPIPGTQITLRFTADQIEGRAGCNHYGGGYTFGDDGAFRASDVFMTEMACMEPEGVMAQETTYLHALGLATQASQAGDRLTFEDSAGEPILVFQRLSDA
jgi:heat shock protein HslJ